MIDDIKRLAGPYTGEGLTDFAFSFKIFKPTDVAVVAAASGEQDTSSSQLTYGTDYTVSMNSDQDATPGGTVTLKTALTSGQTLSVVSAVPYDQTTQLTNYSRFPPEIINTALDRTVVQIQQLKEAMGRAITVPETSSKTGDQFRDEILNLAANAEGWANTSASSASAAAASAAEAKETLTSIKTETDTQISRVVASGDSQITRIENASAGTLANIGVSCAEVVWTQSEAVASGTAFTLPQGMTYVVGRKHLRITWNGEELRRGVDFNESGSGDLVSTTVTFAFPLSVGDEMMAWTAPLGRGNIDELYSLIQSNSDAIADLSSKVVYKSDTTTSSTTATTSGS